MTTPAAEQAYLDDLLGFGTPSSTIDRAVAAGLTLAETRAWVRYMSLDALETCLAAGLALDEVRATYAAKRLPPQHVLDRLIAIRSGNAA